MKVLINNAFNHLFEGDKADLFNGALNFNTTPNFQKIVLKKMLSMIMESSIKFEELSNTQSLISLAQALSNGDSKQFFDEEFVDFDNNLIEKINEAARSLDIEPTEELDIAELYPLAAGSLIEAKLYSLGSLNSGKAASSNIPVHKKIHRINDFREAVAFMAERPNLLVFARIKQFNSNSTTRESDSPFILINTGAEILAIDFSNCSDWKAKGIVNIRDKDVNERELTSGDLLAVMFSALINQTNYLDNGKDKECLVFSSTSGSDKKLPAILNAPVAEIKPVTPSDIAYSKINPNYEWLDEFIDQELLSSVINLEQSRSETGSLKTYYLTSSRMTATNSIQLEEVDSYDEYRDSSRAVLLAHNPNAVGTETELFNKKLEVARFNKAVLASLTIESLWLELNGVGRELVPLLIKAKTKGIFDALAPIIQKEAKEGTRINTWKANEDLYQSEVIAFLYKGKGLRGVLENARHEASSYGYNTWNQDRKPFLMINGRKVNKDSADALKAAKCAYNDKNATHFMAVNLSRYDVLEALINALPIEDESEARELKMKLRAIKYMPEFERQSFGDHTITKKANYPTDRESLEDYIRNPFFEECRLLIPLSNAGVKYLTGQ